MPQQTIDIVTRDGTCPTIVSTPAGEGPWPAVILYMDGLAIRPALIEFAQRMADGGYIVLLPDLFYRYGAYKPLVPAEVFAGDFRAIVGPMMATTDFQKAAEDTGAFLAYLDTRTDVKGSRIGVTGYCFGGGCAIRAAGTYPDRIAAAASFHGGRLATDDAISPHRVAPRIKADVYIGVADHDHSYPPEQDAMLRAAFDAAGVTYRDELYVGAEHGWTQTDFPIYDEAAAERHWRELFALFERTLG